MALFTQSRTLSASSTAIPTVMGQPALVPTRLSGNEGLNGLFTYHLDLKTPDDLHLMASQAANFKLNEFLGRELTVQIELEGSGSFISGMAGGGVVNAGAGTREITGLIADAQLLGESGRFVHYRLTLRPWLYLATLNSDCRIYQDKTVIEILDDLLGQYSFPLDKRLIDTYPKRDYQTQFNESDYHFFCRLCEEWGINWFCEHSDGKQRLVLIDNRGAHKKNPSIAYQQIPFYPEGHKLDRDYIHHFTPAETLTAGRYRTSDYDYTRPKADLSIERSDPRETAHNQQEVYQWHFDAHYSQPDAGADKDGNDPTEESHCIARMRMESLRQRGQQAHGSGHLRGMVPGCTFALQKHPQDAANTEYLITSTTLLIEDIAQVSQTQSAQTTHEKNASAQRYKVDVDFEVHRLNEPYRPARHTTKPFTHGPQTARVVGPAEQNIWTDQYGRIKVQFPWDRLGENNQNSSCWIRVSSPWAGNQLGAMQVPRIGQEVIVDFIGGDPDLPICTGRVHNQSNLPPWSLPGQSALSGFRSRELTQGGGNSASGRSNHLILDDTEKKIQAQLKSDHLHSQLSLGHITRIEDQQGRKDPRGEGFELRTDGHGALRATHGMLITTEARNKAGAHITDMGETVQRLTQARDQHEQLAELARTHTAQDDDDQQRVASAISAQNEAIKGVTCADTKDSGFPELSAPHLILASPAGIETSTPQSTHLSSGEHIALTSGGHTSLSVGKSLYVSVREKWSVFVHKLGIKLIAASGKVHIQAQSDEMQLLAQKVLSLISQSDWVEIKGKKGVRLHGGSSVLEISDLTQFFTPAPVFFHGSLETMAPQSKPLQLEPLPATTLPDQLRFSLQSHAANGQPYVNTPYLLYKDGIQIAKGWTDEFGHVLIKNADNHALYSVKLANGLTYKLPSGKPLDAGEQLANQGIRTPSRLNQQS